jgi:hypothetical protein
VTPCRDHTIEFRSGPALEAGRTIGQARCGACDWIAVMTGDTKTEVQQFLTARLIDHAIDAHREA